MTAIKDFDGYKPTWCPGCGNHGIGIAVKSALVQLGLDPSSLVAVFGIGCSGNTNDFLNAYAIHSLHGRAIPGAIGVKLANHKLPVIVIAGDGDIYGEGGNHLIHACRGNHDITVIVHDNRVYGLTTGQTSPSSPRGFKSKSTPFGSIEVAFNPLASALVNGATFIGQTFAGDVSHMIDIIKKGISHRGFSLVNVLQPCVTFNKINTYQYYQEHVYKLPQEYKGDNLDQALDKALEAEKEKFPLGVLYEISKSAYTDELPQLKEKALVEKERDGKLEEIVSQFS